ANPSRARSSSSKLATSFWSMKVRRNNPKKMAPTGIATVQPTGISELPNVTTLPTANAVRETANNAFGILVIVQFASVDDSFINLTRNCLSPGLRAARELANAQHFLRRLLPCQKTSAFNPVTSRTHLAIRDKVVRGRWPHSECAVGRVAE